MEEVKNDCANEECSEIIYNSVVNMYQIEWQKTHDIENKATGLVGFVGVIFGLIVASVSAIISAADSTTKGKIFSSIFLLLLLCLILAFLTVSILYGIKALTVKNWSFLEADKFAQYCNRNPAKNELYTKITNEITKIIVENRDLNRKIASYLKISYILFMTSIIVLFGYFILFLYVIR